MAETTDEIAYRFTPHTEGAFVRGVPQRDLTAADVARMTGQQRADAFAPHPVIGSPLYTPVAQADEDQPKWYLDKLARAEAAGETIPARLPDETQRQYEERVAAGAGDGDDEDGDA